MRSPIPAKGIFLLLPLCLAANTATHAQTQQGEIPQVDVKGRRKNVKERAEFARHAQTTEVLTQEDLNRNNPAFIEQTLGTMAGVQVDKRTQLGGQRVVIRGYGNDQKFNNWGIKAYFQTVPLTTADGITMLDDIDFSALNNIEVIKGPAATEYGGGVGGVVRFYLKDFGAILPKGIAAEQSITGGSFNLFQTTSRVHANTDRSSSFVQYTHLQSDGYRPHGKSLKNYLTAFSEYRISDRQRISFFATHNFSHEETSGQIPYSDYYAGIDNGNAAYIRKNAGTRLRSTRFAVMHDAVLAQGLRLRTALFFNQYDAQSIAAGAYSQSGNPGYGLRSSLHWQRSLGKDFENGLELGTEIQESGSLASSYRFTGKNDSIPLQVNPISGGSYFRTRTTQQNYFALNRLRWKPYDLSLTLGVSANQMGYNRTDLLALPGLVSGYNKDLSFDKQFATILTPKIALQKRWKEQIFLLGYSEGYNAPTAATAFISGPNIANDALKPERAKMLEASVQGLLLKSKFDYQISVFQIDVTDKLTQLSAVDPANNAPYSYWANTGTQRNRGLEISLGYSETFNQGPLRRITPFFNSSFYDFKYTDFKTKQGSTIKDFSGNQVVGVPKTRFSAGLDFVFDKGFYLNNTFMQTGDLFADFGNANAVKGFHQYNAKLGWCHSFPKIGLDIDLYAAGNNLTNQVNYTFLFVGNAAGDSDPGSGFAPGNAADVSPGPSKAYFFGGLMLRKQLF